jgi:hypothetical protein
MTAARRRAFTSISAQRDQSVLLCYRLPPHAVQVLVNLLGLKLLTRSGRSNGGTMTTISFVSAHPVVTTGDRSFAAIALFCCCGLTATLGVLTFGIDLTAAAWV